MRHRTLVILLTFAAFFAMFPFPARAAPVLSTDKNLYTVRDQQVILSGSDLAPGQAYFVWVKMPSGNRSIYTGVSFQPVSGGLVPPDVAYPLTPNASLGTYLLTLSTSGSADNTQATAHFGVWGTIAPVYERTESVSFLGGGIFPGTGLRLAIEDPTGNTVQQSTLASTTNGDFNATWRIPPNAATNIYSAVVQGTGSFDNPQADVLSEAKFTVTDAVLTMSIIQEPNATYQRTQNAAFSLVVQYPDGTPVTSSLANIRPVTLLQSQTTIAFVNLTVANPANGIWVTQTRIETNATLSSQYRFEIPSMSFDDGYGNKGATANIFSNYFTVKNASLTITSQLNGTNIQIPFGQVSIISRVTYPDGSSMTTGTVTVVVSRGSSISLQSTYDPTIGEWRATYSSTILDLVRVGTWKLQVSAADSYGNMGIATYDLAAQPYLFIGLLAAVVALILLARWSISRYGRRTYFRLRKLLKKPHSRPLA